MIRRLLLVPALILCVVFAESCTGCSNPGIIGQTDGGNSDGGDGGGGDGGNTTDGGNTIDTGPGDFRLDGGSGGSGTGVTYGPDGGLVLSSNDVNLHYAWIANSSAGTVSKFDTDTGNEVARYYSVIPIDGRGSPNGLVADSTGVVNSPSRTALDLAGNVWIANRAPGLQGSATKIANTLDQCRPLADGGYLTSRDLNGDGRIDTDPDAGEFVRPTNLSDPTQYDSCVLFSTPLGSAGGGGGAVKGRALAVSQGSVEGGSTDGLIWFGHHQDQTVYKLNATNGQPMPVAPDGGLTISLPAWGPYGAAVDSQQRLWLVAATQARLALVDTRTSTLIYGDIAPVVSTGAYGIAVDGRDRVWLASWQSGPTVSRYDHGPGLDAGAGGTWTQFNFSSARSQTGSVLGNTRGIACDDQNICWASGHQSSAGQVAQLIGFNGDDGGTYTFRLPDGGRADFIDATNTATDSITSIGVGLDRSNNIWVNNFGNLTGDAMRITRDGGSVLYTQPQLGNLYTYSDFTGYQLRHFTAPQGRFTRTFAGCGTGTIWGPISWSATLPPNTSVTLYVKVGNNPATLESTTQYGPFTASPANLQAAGVPARSYLQVLFVLSSSDRRNTPTLYSFSVSMSCPPLGG